MAKGARGGKRGKLGGKASVKYLSADNALYESNDEVLYVERMTNAYGLGGDVLDATSDDKGNIQLTYATPTEYYKQNSKTTYALYEMKCGITNADEIHGSRRFSNDDYVKHSKVKDENDVKGIRSVGINWDKVNSVSGQTYKVKDLLKSKGFKWNGAGKSWVKS